jgi:hypothetical protein
MHECDPPNRRFRLNVLNFRFNLTFGCCGGCVNIRVTHTSQISRVVIDTPQTTAAIRSL